MSYHFYKVFACLFKSLILATKLLSLYVVLIFCVSVNTSAGSAYEDLSLYGKHMLGKEWLKKMRDYKKLLKSKSLQGSYVDIYGFDYYRLVYIKGLINGLHYPTYIAPKGLRLGFKIDTGHNRKSITFISLYCGKRCLKIHIADKNLIGNPVTNNKNDKHWKETIENIDDWGFVFDNLKKYPHKLLFGKISQIWLGEKNVLMLTNTNGKKLIGHLLIGIKDKDEFEKSVSKIGIFLNGYKPDNHSTFFNNIVDMEKNAEQVFYIGLNKDTHLVNVYNYTIMLKNKKDEIEKYAREISSGWNAKYRCPKTVLSAMVTNKYWKYLNSFYIKIPQSLRPFVDRPIDFLTDISSDRADSIFTKTTIRSIRDTKITSMGY